MVWRIILMFARGARNTDLLLADEDARDGTVHDASRQERAAAVTSKMHHMEITKEQAEVAAPATATPSPQVHPTIRALLVGIRKATRGTPGGHDVDGICKEARGSPGGHGVDVAPLGHRLLLAETVPEGHLPRGGLDLGSAIDERVGRAVPHRAHKS